MKFKKFVLLLLCFCLIFALVGCKDNENSETTPNNNIDIDYEKSLSLLYCANDTYDPYTLITKVNAELCMLLRLTMTLKVFLF